MSTPNPSNSRSREILSALADGQVLPGEFDAACAAWRDDAEGRACWHAYHLIGDVMRSDELATWSGHDEEFLQSLRTRLAKEPVPLAPSPRPAVPSFWHRLTAPAAVAAGFAVVAGAVVVFRSPSLPEVAPPTTLASNTSPQTLPPAEAFALIRDNHFDSYFEAHRQQSIRRAALVDGPVAPPRIEATVIESR